MSNVPQRPAFFSPNIWVWVLCVLIWGLAQGADLARERRLRAEIEAGIRVGEAVSLKTGSLDFLAVHTAATTPRTRGGVILLHGQGAHPEWTTLIQPLRTELPGHGWETLSVQLPLTAADVPERAYETLIPEAFPRIAFALEFLKSRDIKQVALVGHGWGARVAVEWLARDGVPKEAVALVAIGLAADPARLDSGALGALKRVKVPTLDLYGSQDLDGVLGTARLRVAAARGAKHPDYRQLEIPGADHFFTGLPDTLVTRVRAWLSRLPPPAEEKEPPPAAPDPPAKASKPV